MPDTIHYTGLMLPDVDYSRYDDDWGNSLVTLEHGILEDYKACLETIKTLFIEHELEPFCEAIILHFASYVGIARTIYYPHAMGKELECLVNVIAQHSDAAWKLFSQHPVNFEELSTEERHQNADKLREVAPGSIVVQTIRLGRRIFDTMDEIKIERPFKLPIRGEKKECVVEPTLFMKTMMPLLMKQRPHWDSEKIPDRDVLNQLAIQLSWLIAYFAHMANRPIEEACLQTLFNHLLQSDDLTPKYLQTYGVQNKPEPLSSELQAKLDTVSTLSQKTHAEYPKTIINDRDRDIQIAQATLEKCCIELLTQGRAVKILLLTVFQYWFMLDGPRNGFSKEDFEHFSPVSMMNDFIPLIKEVSDSLPEPELSDNIHQLNEHIEALKVHLPAPDELEKVSEADKLPHTLAIDGAIRDCLGNLAGRNIAIDILAMILFNQWLRLSIFFGVSEKDWQKLDFYFAEILSAARGRLAELAAQQSIMSQITAKSGRNSPCPCGSGKKYKKCCLQ